MNMDNPNIVGVIVNSIVDHSEDWTIGLVNGDPVIHRHKSGIGIWAYCDKVQFWEPEYAKAIQISIGEKILLLNAINGDRVEKEKKIRAKAARRLLKQFTKPSWFRNLLS